MGVNTVKGPLLDSIPSSSAVSMAPKKVENRKGVVAAFCRRLREVATVVVGALVVAVRMTSGSTYATVLDVDVLLVVLVTVVGTVFVVAAVVTVGADVVAALHDTSRS